jgi:translocation and assembly module TamB
LKRFGEWLAGGIIILIILVVGLLVLADSRIGHEYIAERISRLEPKSGLRIKVGAIEGSIYGATQISGLELSDLQGKFLIVPDAQLDWSPLKWWNNRLEINDLLADEARLLRLPKLRPGDPNKPILPEFDLHIGRFEIKRIDIAEGIAGNRRVGRAVGKADIVAGKAKVKLDLDADEGDALSLSLDADPEKNLFDVSANLNAPAGGIFGKLIGTSQPAALQVEGDGDWNAWRGRGILNLGGTRIANLALTANDGRFGLNGALQLQSITKGKLQRLAGTVTNVRGAASLKDRKLDGEITLASKAITVRADGVADLGENAFRDVMVEANLLDPPALFPNMRGENIRLKARINGKFNRAGYEYLLTSPRVFFDATGLEQVEARGRGGLGPWPVTVPISLTAARVTGVGDVAGGILANLRLSGPLLVAKSAITGDGLKFTSDKLSGTLALFIDLTTGRYDVGIAGALNQYLIPGLGLVEVKSSLKVVPSGTGKGSRVIGRGEAIVRRFDNGFLAGLAGGLPTLTTGLERGPDGILYLKGLTITAPGLSLSGNGRRMRDGTFHFEGSGQQGRYGPLSLVLDGRIERPKLVIRLARPAEALGLADVLLNLNPDDNGYAWTANGQSTLGNFTGNGRINLPRGNAAVIQIAQMNAGGLTARGELTALTGGLSGNLALGGRGISGSLALSPQNSIQRIDAKLNARDARLDGPPVLTARRASFDGTILLLPGGPSVEGTLTGQGLTRGPWSLARMAGNIKLRNGVGEIRGAFAGSRGRGFDVQTVIAVTPDRWRIMGGGTIDRKPVSLATAAELIREAGGWRLAPTRLNYAGGNASVAGLFGDRSTELDATLSAMPVGLIDLIRPGLRLGGAASGTVRYVSRDGTRPSGAADLRIKGLTRAGLVLASRPVDMGIAANLANGVAGVRIVAASGGQTIGRAQARLQAVGGSSLFDQFARAPVFAQLRYDGQSSSLWRLAGVSGLDVSGPISVGVDVSGRVDDPIIRGSLKTENARIESPNTGMVLTNVRATGRFGGGSKLMLDSFTAKAGKEGSVSGRGVFDLSASRQFAMDLSLQAQDASLIARDDLAATVTGPISIHSEGGRGTISGDIVLNRSRFRLGQTTAAQSVPQLKVRELNVLNQDAAPVSRSSAWQLAIRARAPNRAMVTGLGIESEWRATLEIGGTPFSPVLRGRADLLRGDYEFAGRTFSLERGAIRFNGENPPDPILDILAAGDTQGLTAQIRVTGTGQRPEIRFTSNPSLPEDELLSRLLFGASITTLSAPEAVQLASAVASLQGGGGLNPINALRSAIGLDRLRILPADTATGQGTSIAAGKYLTRRTYVEIITDGRGYSATRAEFQVTRWLSILSTISTIGRQSAAVRVSKDY